MRDNVGYQEITTLSEDGMNTSVADVFDQIEYSGEVPRRDKDPINGENDGHAGFYGVKPLVIKDVDKCVVIPSPNKWNCHTFPARSKVTVSAHAGNSDAVCRHDQAGTMNSARPMTPQTLEINGLYNSQQNSKIASSSLSDYKVQVEETTGNGLNRTDSGYKRSAFNEKLTKLKLHRIGVNKTDTPLSPTNDVSPVEAQTKKWPTLSKSASFRAYSGTRQHRPSTRSSSADPATEEKTIFGFRVLKGTLPSTSVMTGKQNDQRSSSFVRGGSLRLPRRGYYDGGSNSSGRSGRPLFYAPKESSLSKSKEVSEVCSMAEDARTVNSRDSADKKEKSNEKMESKEKGEQKVGKLVIRAESLQEGKSRLQEFREKQRIGKLTRSFTNPEHEASETLSKSKNIRESLADIRERIRERRRKKEEGKRLQTTPGNESTSSKESVEKENIVDSSAEQQSELLSSEGATYEEKKEDKDLVLKKKEEEIEELPTSSVRQEDLNANEIELQEDINANKLQPSVNSDDKSGCTLRKLENNEKTSSCDQTKPSESKKPTKRERRKLERYQRSKTMSAIMYNDISLSAAREIAHEENDPHSNKGKQLITMPSVSEVKKRFLESEGTNVNSKTNELGLFYSLKVPTSSKVGSKKEKNKNADGNADTERDKPPIQNKSNFPEANFDNKPKLSRRYTLGMSTDLSKDAILKNRRTVLNNNSQNNGSVVRNPDDGKEETFLSGGFLTKRRHTFSEDSSWSKLNRNNLKASESVEKLREKFSQGEALFPKRWHSASKHVSRQTFSSEDMKPDNETSQSKQPRRRVTSEGGAAKIKTEVETSKNCSNGSSLCRRHTIGNRPTKIEKLNSEKLNEQKESRKIHDNSLLKDDVAYGKKPASVEKKNFSANEGSCSSATKKEDPVKSIVLKEKEERQVVKKKKEEGKTSVSKLRNLFLGKPSSREKKPKLRDRRAKTIAEGISPEITKELVINSHNNTPWSDLNGSVVKPDHYVTESATEKPTEEWNSETIRCPGEDERAGDSREEGTCPKIDLRPGRYLSSGPEVSLSNFVPSSPEETEVDSVFHDEEKAEKKPNVPDINDADVLNKSLESDPSLNTSSSNDGTKCKENISKAEVSHENSVLLKDQYLDDYLTTIETLAGSPKNQRKFLNSTRGLTQKPKLNGTQTLSRDINVAEGDSRNFAQNKHLNLPHTNLMHSWSTSDLDKLFYSGESNNFPHVASEREISTEDLDEISDRTTRLQSLTEGRTKIRPKRSSSKSLNPLKSLMERTDIRTNTEEPEDAGKSTTGFEKPKKKSTPRKKRSQLEPWRRHTLDPVALAALASREDFSRVSLRKTKGPGKEKDEFDGSLPVMLIQIKGRRQVQTRLVEPKLSSLNSGDCFVLVTRKELFCWIGNNANTIEKAKAVEISSKIQKRGDLNCKTGDVLHIDEAKQGNSLAYKKFCKILEGDSSSPIEDSKLCPDDEFYEREVISTNKVYKVQEGDPPHLVPVEELCGHMPRFTILNTKEVFVFDFGSEVYLWTGQQSLSGKRKVAFHLAQMLYKQQFKYDGVVDPVQPRRVLKRPKTADQVYHDEEGKEAGRPAWTLFARLHEKAETLMFQEKFFDWPDPTKIIKMKGHISSGELPERPPPIELKPCDVTEMQKPASDLEPAVLEGTNLGRGLGTPDEEINGVINEGNLVTTIGLKVWLVTQNKHFLLPKKSEGHFHSGDGYVVRWEYFVAKNRVVKDKRGRARPLTGRQRCAYFFWQGNECTVNEKGAAAIMAVELDEERGPQIRVLEGKEPPHFLKLFDGAMVIHLGKRIRLPDGEDNFSDKSTVRMYCVRNEDTSEGCLVQVRRCASSLRSKSSFVVVDCEAGKIYVWHGCKASEYHRKAAVRAANYMKDRRPTEVNLSEEQSCAVMEVEEGQEPESFWRTVGGKKSSYTSLLKDPLNCEFSPRLFHLTSSTGYFSATEILCQSRYPGRTCPYPVLQEDLYFPCQPTTFILDAGDEVYVWEGWMPLEIAKDKKGSAKRRWDEERKLALQTALLYVKEANSRVKKGAYVVQAGLEPLSFISHFPFWERRDHIAQMKVKEGRNELEKRSVKDVLETFTKKYYSFQELTGDSPPDGVDPSKLETYLRDDEFERIFEMKRELFNQLPGWKQDILKKAFGLF